MLSCGVEFEEFAEAVGPRLRAGLVAAYGPTDGLDAAAEALAYGWEHWDRMGSMLNPDGGHWRNPDLFWPDDRRWFVATDVDFWSLYIGGDEDFTGELAATVPTATCRVALDTRLEIEV